MKWKICSVSLWVLCCLTSSSKWSAMFSSESGRMSFLSRLPWMWRARLTPAIAITRARRVTTAAVSMVSNWGEGLMTKAGGKFRSSDSTCWDQRLGSWRTEERLVLLGVKCPFLCSVLADFSCGSVLAGSYIRLTVTDWKLPEELDKDATVHMGAVDKTEEEPSPNIRLTWSI